MSWDAIFLRWSSREEQKINVRKMQKPKETSVIKTFVNLCYFLSYDFYPILSIVISLERIIKTIKSWGVGIVSHWMIFFGNMEA